MKAVPFEQLAGSDLIVDRVYRGGPAGNFGDDPLGRLLPVGNRGGFRPSGSIRNDNVKLVALYTSGEHPDWPDAIDPYSGTLTYFGDNRSPGTELHKTARLGNELLRKMFERASGDADARRQVPPIFVFSRAANGRDLSFQGLAVPGSPSLRSGDDLVAIWRSAGGARFQNYRATFTILDEAHVSREWIDCVLAGDPLDGSCPLSWRKWVKSQVIKPLISERIESRSREEQLPDNQTGTAVLEEIHQYFNVELGDATQFESCAVDIWRILAPSTGQVVLTRRSRDGGFDASGAYLLGPAGDPLKVEFALEAKCFNPNNPVGVKLVSRLISRLRFRQFGVFVTTSFFASQAYREVREDKHPVVLICGRDIVDALSSIGISNSSDVRIWLKSHYQDDA